MISIEDASEHIIEISDELILVNKIVKSSSEIIEELGSLLTLRGYVKASYIQAVLEREEKFPTGLETHVMGVAIPHSDTNHVNRPAIAIASLNKPVIFRAMEDPGKEIEVIFVLMLAIANPKAVVHILRNIFLLLGNEKALTDLKNASKSKSSIKEILVAKIGLDALNDLDVK